MPKHKSPRLVEFFPQSSVHRVWLTSSSIWVFLSSSADISLLLYSFGSIFFALLLHNFPSWHLLTARCSWGVLTVRVYPPPKPFPIFLATRSLLDSNPFQSSPPARPSIITWSVLASSSPVGPIVPLGSTTFPPTSYSFIGPLLRASSLLARILVMPWDWID